MYYTYVLESIDFGRYYIWYSQNIEKRLEQHNTGQVRSTKHYIPYKIKYFEVFKTKTEALKREKELKKMNGNSRFKEIIRAGVAQG